MNFRIFPPRKLFRQKLPALLPQMPPKRRVLDSSQDSSNSDQKKIGSSPNSLKSEPVAPIKKAKIVDLKIRSNFPQFYNEATKKNTYEAKRELYDQVMDEENRYRELFAQDRSSKDIGDPHLMMIDVQNNQDLFKYANLFPEEKNVPFVFDTQAKKKTSGQPAIVPHEQFVRNFDVFCESQLKYLNWNNVFVAGGSVLACMTPLEGPHAENLKTKRDFYHKIGYRSSDIDLFIYGLESEEEANKKLTEIYEQIMEANPRQLIAFRSQHAVTLVSEYPYRHIQIVLRLYKSPAEILMGFDVDCCSVGYDGKKVWMLPRAQRAITHQYNTVDMSRRSPSFEMRLAKYAQRGFSVIVPTLDRTRVDPQLFEKRFDQLQGLARLLLLERLESPEARTRFKELQRLRRLRPSVNIVSFWNSLDPDLGNDEYSKERLQEMGGPSASDYSTVFLPWGPNYKAEKVRKLMYSKDMVLNSKWYDPLKTIHTHPCFFGTAKEIIGDCCGRCPIIPPEEVDPESPYVSGKITWVTVNPGAQTKIGSFHPITEGDWTDGAYLSDKTALIEKMCHAVNADDSKTVKKLLDDGVDVNGRDCLGRTPLMIAAFSNSVASAKVLIASQARISARSFDGRTAFHIACSYGHIDIVELIIERGKHLKKVDKMEVEKKVGKKSSVAKPKKSKKSKGSDDEDDEDDGDGDDGEGDEEGNEDDETFWSIKAIIDRKKKTQQEEMNKLDPSFKDEMEDTFDIESEDWDHKLTPLQLATFFGHGKVMETLLDSGANLNKSVTRSNQTFPLLFLTLVTGNVEAAKLLLSKGAKINEMDQNGDIILHCAVRSRNLPFIKMLVEWKGKSKEDRIKVNHFNKSALTPIMVRLPDQYAELGGNNNDEDEDDMADDDPHAKKRSKKNQEIFKDNLDDATFEIIKYLITNGAKAHITENDLPSKQEQLEIGMNQTGASSKRENLRQLIYQPISAATKLLCPRLVKLLLDNGADANWIDNNDNDTPMNVIEGALEENNKIKEKKSKLLEKAKARLKKVTPGSFEEYELKKHIRINSITKKSSNRGYWYRQTELKEKKLDKLNPAIREIKAMLKKAGGKRFENLALTTADNYLKQAQKQKKQAKKQADEAEVDLDDDDGSGDDEGAVGTKSTDENLVKFEGISEKMPGTHASPPVYDETEQPKYMELFDAIFKGDIKRVEDLTIKKPIGKQVHVASLCSLSHMTTIHLAVELNNPKMVAKLIDIAIQQFTPLPAPQKVDKEGKVRPINNYELQGILQQIRPGNYLDHTGYSLHEEYKPRNPNEKLTQLNCITSPSCWIEATDSSRNTVFHIGAKGGYTEALEELLKICRSKKIVPHPYNTVQKHKYPDFNTFLTTDLIWERNQSRWTAVQVAIVYGNIKTAKLLVENGFFQVPAKAVSSGEEYTGLLVGGKKMDWHKKFKGSFGEVDESREKTALHLAAGYGQPKSIEFLVTQAPTLWAKNQVGDTKKTPKDIDLYAQDPAHVSSLLIAVRHGHIDAVKKILELDASTMSNNPKKLIEVTLKNGVNALHVAASLGNKEMIEVLLKNGADVESVDKFRGWNALHFAAWGDYLDCAKVLVQKSKKSVNTPSFKLLQTPLMIAAFYGSSQTLEYLLGISGCDPLIRDACGNTALYYSILGGHAKCAELLLKVKDNGLYITENGVGVTTPDASFQKLLISFENFEISDEDDERAAVWKLFKDLKGRKLSPSAEVRRFTELSIEEVKEEMTQDEKKMAARAHRWRRGDSDDEGESEAEPAEEEQPGKVSVHDGKVLIAKYDPLPKETPDVEEKKEDPMEESEEEEENDEEEKEESPTSLKGMVVALTGTLSIKRDVVIKMIEKNGGTYASSITKKVTHLICEDPEEDSGKLKKAKDQGIKLVGEDFLDNFKK